MVWLSVWPISIILRITCSLCDRVKVVKKSWNAIAREMERTFIGVLFWKRSPDFNRAGLIQIKEMLGFDGKFFLKPENSKQKAGAFTPFHPEVVPIHFGINNREPTKQRG